ncbi:MAG: hypothetical protein IT334_11480, partial [Thermomicrobiales bacterium]|nr:hypothetical protein [Thermomicrobiales bacterium]
MQNPGDGRNSRPPGQSPGGGNNSNKPKGDAPEPRRSRIPSWVVVVLLVGIAGWYIYNYFVPRDETVYDTISYSAFLDEVEANNV